MTKIVIQVKGGAVQYVCSNDPNVVIVLHDEDNLAHDGAGADEIACIFDKASLGCSEVEITDSRELTSSGELA